MFFYEPETWSQVMVDILLDLILGEKVDVHFFIPIFHLIIGFPLPNSRFIVIFKALVTTLLVEVVDCVFTHGHPDCIAFGQNPLAALVAWFVDAFEDGEADEKEEKEHGVDLLFFCCVAG